MRLIFPLFILILSQNLWAAPAEKGAFGTEVGVARLSDGKKTIIGTSWMLHFEIQADPFLGIFLQGGESKAKDGSDVFNQRTFLGGVKFNFLPEVELRLGLAKEVIEIDKNGLKETNRELGPMAGLAAYIPVGALKLGTSATVIRTGSLTSTALRAILLVMF